MADGSISPSRGLMRRVPSQCASKPSSASSCSDSIRSARSSSFAGRIAVPSLRWPTSWPRAASIIRSWFSLVISQTSRAFSRPYVLTASA